MKKILVSTILCLAIACLSSCSNKEYVTFYNYNGDVLYRTPYEQDKTPPYLGVTPKKPSDDMYDYTFKGWTERDENKNYYALFDRQLRKFNVTFLDYYDNVLSNFEVTYGESALDYYYAEPERINTEREHYYFSGWSGGELTYVTADTIFKPTYNVVPCYSVTFYDDDGRLLNVEYVEEGKAISYTYENQREAGSDHFYVFASWSGSVNKITEDIEVYATYKLVNAYTVTFLDYDGSILGTSKVPEGGTATYNGYTPHRSSTTSGDYRYDYTFSGWSDSLNNVRYDMTVTAEYSVRYTFNGDAATYVKQHLNSYGSGSYHSVSTGEGSTLGYQGSSFYVSYQNNGSLYSIFTATYQPGSSYFYSDFEVRDGSTTTYQARQYVYVSNHVVSDMQLDTLITCRYTTDSQLELVVMLCSLAAQYAINRASRYLEDYGLPYVW